MTTDRPKGNEPPRSPAAADFDNVYGHSVTAVLAHELKTPLSAILVAAEIMKSERLGPVGGDRYLGYARDIHATALHALAVVDQLASGVTVAQSHDAEALPSLPDIVSHMVGLMQPLAERAGLRLTCDVEPMSQPARLNPTLLGQILLNLVSNAIKYTAAGGAVTVALESRGGVVSIEVRDTGRGPGAIAPTLANGLGLPLAKALAEELQAVLEFEDSMDGGAVARLKFPKLTAIAETGRAANTIPVVSG